MPRQYDDLRKKAEHARRLATSIFDEETREVLEAYAVELDDEARRLEVSPDSGLDPAPLERRRVSLSDRSTNCDV